MNNNESELKKFLKIITAYFILYLIHFVIYPNTPFYTNSDTERFIQGWSLLLFPFFDIFILKSNFFYGCIGIAIYDICVFVYSAEGAYDIGRLGLFDKGPFAQDALIFDISFFTIIYLVIHFLLTVIVFVVETIKYNMKSKENKQERP